MSAPQFGNHELSREEREANRKRQTAEAQRSRNYQKFAATPEGKFILADLARMAAFGIAFQPGPDSELLLAWHEGRRSLFIELFSLACPKKGAEIEMLEVLRP